MKNKYELINEPENLNAIVQLIRNNILNVNLITEISIYDRFYSLEGNKSYRYLILSQEYNKSTKTIQRIMKKLSEKAK